MKIRHLTLSNILSFAPAESLSWWAETIDFTERSWELEQLTILIWPNGSWKSNFLQVIRLLFHGLLLKSCEYTPERKSVTQKKQHVFVWSDEDPNLPTHRHYTDIEQYVEIWIILTSLDIHNIQLIRNKRKKFKKILTTFTTNIDIHIDQWETPWEILNKAFTFFLDNTTGSFVCQHEDSCPTLVYEYIRRYHFFQAACDFLALFDDTKQSSFQRSFALLGSERSYTITNETFDTVNGLSRTLTSDANQYSLHHIRHQLLTLLHEELPIFAFVKQKLIATYTSLLMKHSSTKAYEKTLDAEWMQTINAYLSELFEFTFSFAVPEDEFSGYEFFFIPHEWSHRIRFSDLGSGEKSIVHFLFEVFGQQIKDWLFLIEEPELHVHPHLQDVYLKLLQSIASSQWTQCLISTHSPFFVNYSTIWDLVRFQKVTHDGVHCTKLFKPHHISMKEKNLIKSLDYNIAWNIFFVDKAIIVEWPDDHYFFEHLINDWKKKHPQKEAIRNYDLFQLNGKQLFRQFQTFLRKFGLETFYIWDRDNVWEILHIDYFSYRFELKKSQWRDETIAIKHHYGDLVAYLRSNHEQLFTHIIKEIDNLYTHNIFILKQGSIENYVSTRRKWFEYMIRFCKNDFKEWKKNPAYTSKREELTTILTSIFW